MYFLTGQGKALEDQSLVTTSLLNILEVLDALAFNEKVKMLYLKSPKLDDILGKRAFAKV